LTAADLPARRPRRRDLPGGRFKPKPMRQEP